MPAHFGMVPGCVPTWSQRRVLAVETVCPAKPRTLINWCWPNPRCSSPDCSRLLERTVDLEAGTSCSCSYLSLNSFLEFSLIICPPFPSTNVWQVVFVTPKHGDSPPPWCWSHTLTRLHTKTRWLCSCLFPYSSFEQETWCNSCFCLLETNKLTKSCLCLAESLENRRCSEIFVLENGRKKEGRKEKTVEGEREEGWKKQKIWGKWLK